MRTLLTLALVALIGSAVVGCKASGEIGDTQTSMSPAR